MSEEILTGTCRKKYFPGITAQLLSQLLVKISPLDASAWKIKFSSNHHSPFIFVSSPSTRWLFRYSEWKRRCLTKRKTLFYSLLLLAFKTSRFCVVLLFENLNCFKFVDWLELLESPNRIYLICFASKFTFFIDQSKWFCVNFKFQLSFFAVQWNLKNYWGWLVPTETTRWHYLFWPLREIAKVTLLFLLRRLWC